MMNYCAYDIVPHCPPTCTPHCRPTPMQEEPNATAIKKLQANMLSLVPDDNEEEADARAEPVPNPAMDEPVTTLADCDIWR